MLKPYQPTPQQPWNIRRVIHLHRRAGFAPTWAEIQRDLKDGPVTAIDRLVGVSRQPENARTSAASDFERLSSVICDAAVGSGNIDRLKAWWLYRMLFTPDPLAERLSLMWHNHFATSNVKIGDVGLMRRQNEIFREFARGSFGDLLRRVARDPAMLLWLDADANRKEHPNENLAREIMELFALGVGNYSERDVKEAARALTGWSVNRGEFRVYRRHHDDGEKTVFGNRGNWTGDDLLDLLLAHPATAMRISYRLCELLLGEGVATRKTLSALATGLRERTLDIGWAVETLLRSKLFFSDNNIGNRVLGPIEFVVGTVRSLELTNGPPSTLLLAEVTANLGQDLFDPPNVFGWPGGRTWLTSRALIGRTNFAAGLVQGHLHLPARPFDAAALAKSHGFTSRDAMGSFFAQLLLGRVRLPVQLRKFAEQPNRLVTAIIASPEAQLA